MNKPAFTSEWNHLHSRSEFYWHLLKTLPEEVLKHTHVPGQWSLLQVMEHLAGVEAASLQYLLKKNYSPLSSKNYLPQGVRSLLLRLALKSPLRFKVPPVAALQPPNTTPPAVLLRQWQGIRNKLGRYLEEAPADVVNKPMFRHPRAGALSLQQMLTFITDHMDHHRKQAKSLLKAQQSNNL
jgi:uncharacterized damage-inducible protein DinB